MGQRALISLLTLLVRCSQFCALTFPRPYRGLRAEELRVTIRMLIAILALSEALTNSIVTVERHTLPGIRAGAPIVKHHKVAADGQAVGLGSLVVDL